MSREVFTTCNGLAVNCVLYQESGLINPWGAGLYYDGIDCWVVNSSGVITGTSSCVPSPTPTPTPTPSPQIYYYNVDRYSSPACLLVTGNLIASSPYSIPINLYYDNGDGYRYYVNYSTGAASVDVDLAGASSDISCT